MYSPARFGLPDDFEAFKDSCRSPAAIHDPHLRKLLAVVSTAYRALAEFVAEVMDLKDPQP